MKALSIPWKCFSLRNKDSVLVFVAPRYLSRVKGIPQAIFPLLLLHCNKQMVLDPDPAEVDVPSQPPDIYCPFMLCEDMGAGDPMSHLDSLITRLKNMYYSSYLHTIHIALQQCQICDPKDFDLSMTLCRTVTVPVAYTPLVGGLCPHALLWQVGEQGMPISVAANKVCQLLEGVTEASSSSSQISKWKVSLLAGSPHSSPTHCQDWGPEVEKALLNILQKEGFREVTSNSGYYWFSGSIRHHKVMTRNKST